MSWMTGLHIPSRLAGPWHGLAAPVQGYLHGFLTLVHVPLPQIAADDPEVPSTFHEDLLAGAPRLRAAFPELARELIAIDGLGVRIACEGAHEGPFFGFMLATGRRVRFDEVHRLHVHDGRVVEDHVSIDLRAIIRQLGTAAR